MGPLIWAGTIPAPLGGNYETRGVGKQRFGDEFFAYVRPVGIGGIDEIHIKLDGPAQNCQSRFAILGLSPDAFTGKAHGAEAETMDRNLFAEGNLPSGRCGKLFVAHD
jgi:hypothetical protein